MTGLGTLVNVAAIVVGGLIGSYMLPKRAAATRPAVTRALGLGVTVLGIVMASATREWLIVLLALGVGALAGELLALEDRLQRLADWALARRAPPKGAASFVVVEATLLYTVGAMAITGAIEDGLRHQPQLLYAKSVLDGVCSLLFAAGTGPGVIWAALPVFIYQGLLTLAAGSLATLLGPDEIAVIGATGGLLVLALGLNLMAIGRFKAANLLPALPLAAVLVPLTAWLRQQGIPL